MRDGETVRVRFVWVAVEKSPPSLRRQEATSRLLRLLRDTKKITTTLGI
jgi:hypothetical protein